MSFIDDIESAGDVRSNDVVVPEWGGKTVHLRALDCDASIGIEAALDEWKQASGSTTVPPVRMAATALCFMIREDDGSPIGISALGRLLKRSPAVLTRLFVEAQGLAPSVESIAGESGAVPSGASSSP